MTQILPDIEWTDPELSDGLKLTFDKMKSKITTIYRLNDTQRILQGDLLKNVEIPIYDGELTFNTPKYAVVLSQDCDLNQDFNSREEYLQNSATSDNSKFFNKMIPSILLCPAYSADRLREGNHLKALDITMGEISKPKKTPWKRIIQNETPRYHYLKESEEFGISDLVLDFKRYYSVSRDYLYSIYHEHYLASLNELYREDLSDRFFNYHSRIGLPE